MLVRDSSHAPRLAPRIADSAQQMARLIDDLMDLSQIRTRRLKLSRTSIDAPMTMELSGLRRSWETIAMISS
jgi:signal transduction histidine kinase